MSTETTTKSKLPNFKTITMNVGDKTTIVLTSVKDGQYGLSYRGLVNGVDSYINFSGNLKRFLPSDLESGSKQLNVAYILTRVADKTFNGRVTSQYTLTAATGTAVAPTQASVVTNVSEKLAAIRAKRT